MMHFCFLALRMTSLLHEKVEIAQPRFDAACFLASAALLPTVFGFRPSLACLRQHADTILLAAVAILLACAEVSIFTTFRWSNTWVRHRILHDAIFPGSDYIEILSFVPAVWMAYRRASDTSEA